MKEQANCQLNFTSRAMQLCGGLVLLLTFSGGAFSQGQSYQSLTANLDGVKIHYLTAGTGKKPLVLLHGFGETSRMWIPLLEGFKPV